MTAYIIRRVLFAVPILVCVNLFTFLLFFFVNSPDDVAHTVLGQKHDVPANVYRWKREHGYHLPLFLNMKDTILYVGGGKEPPEDIARLFHGRYAVVPCRLGEKEVEKERMRIFREREKRAGGGEVKKPTYIDGFSRLVEKIKERMRGDEIVLIDWPDVSREQAASLSGILEKGVPVVVLQREGKPFPHLSLFPVAAVHTIRRETREEDLAELLAYVDAQQVHGFRVFTETIFFKKSVRLFWFNFGKSDRENIDISYQVVSRMGASLLITVPSFLVGLVLNIFLAMMVAYTRGTYIDRMMAVACIIILSVLSLFYYFSAQLVFGQWLRIFPVSGYAHGFSAVRFVLMPVVVTVFMGIGGGVRFYRTIFLEEINKEYVRTARAKGLTEMGVLFKHVLKNAMIPILTNVVLVIPTLFMGSLILESFFGIPGLGGFTLEGIQAQDFRIVGSMVYLGSFLYIVGLLLTDISYTLVDPRVRFE